MAQDQLTMDKRLTIISRAWGKQDGYCFFPWIDGNAEDRAQRIHGYHEGPAFHWPHDRDKILAHMEAHIRDDLYWCPSLFEKKMRRADMAMDEHALWADLDERDPASIEDYPPSIAWESSPGRYQALWIVQGGDVQGASWPGGENQRLTYHLGADPSGWDTTQLLRIPGWRNHKPDRRTEDGKVVRGRLLWANGRRYLPDEFEELPEVSAGLDRGQLVDALAEEVERADRREVWGRVRLKLPKTARELVAAKEAAGDRSERLWWLMRCLADAGCSPVEIVAVVRETVWNKFAGRQDELKRLLTEAAKAVEARSEETKEALEQERGEYPTLVLLETALRGVKPPRWLVEGLISEGSTGFIAGQPKSFKTWFGLDLAISVASGSDFLEHFRVLNPGPVLYVQAEDGPAILKTRYAKVLRNKSTDRVKIDPEGELVWEPGSESDSPPPILVPRFDEMDEPPTISDPGWQSWLDELLAAGHGGEPYRMVILDTLMMMAGEVEENRAAEMMAKIYRPTKLLARKHNAAILFIHHMRKAKEGDSAARGGQLMLGSVANHAWAEDSLYVTHGRAGSLLMETESKNAPGERYEVRNLRSRSARGKDTWEPRVEFAFDSDDKQARKPPRKKPRKAGASAGRGRPRDENPPALKALKLLMKESPRSYTTHEVKDKLAEMLGKKPTQPIYLQAYQQLKKCWERGAVKRVEGKNWVVAEETYDEAEELL